jgi:hypothetical protein
MTGAAGSVERRGLYRPPWRPQLKHAPLANDRGIALPYSIRAGGLERHTADEILRIEPWGPHAVRVRASSGAVDPAAAGALESPPPSPQAELSVDDDCARLVNGRLRGGLGPRSAEVPAHRLAP